MKNCAKRWVYLLAGSAFSAKEVREVCAWLANGSPDEIAALVMRLRRQNMLFVAEEEANVAPSVREGSAKMSGVGRDVTAEIAYVLRTESQLSAREAAEQLAMELKKELFLESKATDIPAYSKEAFGTYVGKLLKRTSPQMLLHLAHRIRDNVIERPTLAWPLQKGETSADGG